METTLDLPEDLVCFAMDTAKMRRTTVSAVIADWARAAAIAEHRKSKRTPEARAARKRLLELGFRPLAPARGDRLISNELVNRIREREGD